MFATHHHTDLENKANLERARAQCRASGENAAVLSSLGIVYLASGDPRTADQLVEELHGLVERDPDELSTFLANQSAGRVDAWMGRFRSAVDNCKRALDVNQHHLFGLAANCRAHLGWMLWMLAYPDQLLDQEARLLEFLSRHVDLFTHAEVIEPLLANHCHFVRDYSEMRERAEALIALARENGFPYWLGCGLVRLRPTLCPADRAATASSWCRSDSQ
jgi:tetratricopeptide (TPR) repeat protein